MPRKNPNSLFSRYRNISDKCNSCNEKISPRGNRKGLCRNCSLKDGYKNGRININKGKKLEYLHTPEVRKRSAESRKGYKHTEEWKRKMSEIMKTKDIKRLFTPEAREKNRLKRIGRKLSEEHKRKIGLAGKGRIKTIEERKKLSEARIGEKSHLWKGGITPMNMKIRRSFEMKLWREAVFKRDNWTCIWCGQRGGRLNADHIKPFAHYPELRFAIDNGRTLCIDCHKKTNTYLNRWSNN